MSRSRHPRAIVALLVAVGLVAACGASSGSPSVFVPTTRPAASAATGPSSSPTPTAEPLATLVLHINRELIHHGAELALLRDLYAHTR